MKKKKLLKESLLILFVASLNFSCAIAPPDVPLCTELSPSRGYCVYTMSSREFEVSDLKPWNGKSWWELRPYMIRMPVESWVEIKKFILKICKKTKKCDQATKNGWSKTVKAIDNKVIQE